MQPEVTTLAYLAGVIDSDGYITIQRTRKANKNRCAPNTYYCLKVGIAGTRTPPHELAVSVFGGNISEYSNGRHRRQYQWSVTGPTARRVLEAIRPFLLVKREQAERGLAFQEMLERHIAAQRRTQKPPYHITCEMQSEREAAWSAMVALNQCRTRKRRTDRLLDGRGRNAVLGDPS
jgi:hypothetical protein